MGEIYIQAVESSGGLAFSLHPKIRLDLIYQLYELEELPQVVFMTGVQNVVENLSRIGGTVVEKLVGVSLGHLDQNTPAIFHFPYSGNSYILEAPIRGNILLHYLLGSMQEPANDVYKVKIDSLPVKPVKHPNQIEFIRNLFDCSRKGVAYSTHSLSL